MRNARSILQVCEDMEQEGDVAIRRDNKTKTGQATKGAW